jgi:hypothetical protein
LPESICESSTLVERRWKEIRDFSGAAVDLKASTPSSIALQGVRDDDVTLVGVVVHSRTSFAVDNLISIPSDGGCVVGR